MLVEVAPLREAFLRYQAEEGLSPGEVARRMGWTYVGTGRYSGQVRADSQRVRRQLGLAWHRGDVRQHIAYVRAEELCCAIGADPLECGL